MDTSTHAHANDIGIHVGDMGTSWAKISHTHTHPHTHSHICLHEVELFTQM